MNSNQRRRAEGKKPPPEASASSRARRPSKHLYVGSPELEAALLTELGATARSVMPGVVGADVEADPIFARTALPDVVRVQADTVDGLATAILEVARQAGASPDVAFVDAPELARDGSAQKPAHPLEYDAALIREVVEKKLEGRRAQQKMPPPTGHRLQALLLGARDAAVAIRPIRPAVDDDPLLAWPSSFPAGRAVPVEVARDAPSSAHRKLDEALLWLDVDVTAEDRVIDLGAAPGGWTRVMRDRGASVIAVDRADMDPALAKDPAVTHLRKDALTIDLDDYAPTGLICDVIWGPEQALEITRRVLGSHSIGWAVITFKLRSPIAFDVLAEARDAVARSPRFVGRLKHLRANKQEVSMLLRRVGHPRRAVATTTPAAG